MLATTITVDETLLATIAAIALPLLFAASYGVRTFTAARYVGLLLIWSFVGICRAVAIAVGVFSSGYLLCMWLYGNFRTVVGQIVDGPILEQHWVAITWIISIFVFLAFFIVAICNPIKKLVERTQNGAEDASTTTTS